MNLADNSPNVLQRVNGKWIIRFGGVVASCPDFLAMSYIHHLIGCQRKFVHVTEMVTKQNGEPVEIAKPGELLESGVGINPGLDEISGDEMPQVNTTEFVHEILSAKDRALVLKGLKNEYERLASLKSKGLAREVLMKKEDIKYIKKYLKDHRLGSQNNCFDSRGGRDRSSVKNSITRGIEKLRKIHISFANHLRETISTGAYCSYATTSVVDWIL